MYILASKFCHQSRFYLIFAYKFSDKIGDKQENEQKFHRRATESVLQRKPVEEGEIRVPPVFDDGV